MISNQNNLTVTPLTEIAFTGSRDLWNDLLYNSKSGSFFLTWEWLFTFWKTLDDPSAKLHILTCYMEDSLIAIAPLYSHSTTMNGLPVRKLSIMGDRVASDQMDIICIPGFENQVGKAIAMFIFNHGKIPFDIITFDSILKQSVVMDHFYPNVPQKLDRHIDNKWISPLLHLDSTPERFIETLGSSTRSDLKRKERALFRDHKNCKIYHEPIHNNDSRLTTLFSLHRSRWIQNKRRSTFDLPYRKVFNQTLLKNITLDQGFFSFLEIENMIVSITYTFICKGNAFFYQNGFDPVFAKYSVGMVVLKEAISHAISLKCQTFDFLRGDEPYKFRFAIENNELFSIMIFNSTLKGRIVYSVFVLRKFLKLLKNTIEIFLRKYSGRTWL